MTKEEATKILSRMLETDANERGCDGACQFDEKKLESILKQINGEEEA